MNLNVATDQNPNLDLHLAYEGIVTSENVESILDLIKRKMPVWLPNSSAGNASRLAVECLQNVIRHAYQSMAYVIIYHEEKTISMQCRNIVGEVDKIKLEANYKILQEYDPSGYQRLYREQLKHAHINERGGAGIGLFDIAYRMGKPPVYKIEPTGEAGLYFYTITIVLTQTV